MARSSIKYLVAIFGSIILSCTTDIGSNETWLKENAVSLSTIDPLDSSTTDLRYLKDAIGNSRVVLLGEAEHGDGSTFLLKSRVVKYLHQELGFKVIAFEASFFGLSQSWEKYTNQKISFDQVKDNLYVMWKGSKECEELFTYIEKQSKTDNPLVLSGVDSRLSGEIEVITLLDSILHRHNLIKDQSEYSFFENTLSDALAQEYKHKIPTHEQNRFIEILESYLQSMENSNVDSFWIQQLKNTRGYVLHSWRSAVDESKDLFNGSFRDRQMADNLIWLINEKYEGEKIIVWAANSHIVKNFSHIDSLYYGSEEILARGMEHSMGEYLHREGVSVYSIITLSYSGRGADFQFEPYPYEVAAEGSLEKLFHDSGFNYAFLDVKNDKIIEGGSQLIRSGLPGYVTIDLNATCDGIFFIDEMSPITKKGEF